MMSLNTVQAGIHSLQIGMMKGKTIAVAACAVVCMLGTEAVFVPSAMNSAYERYENYIAPPIMPLTDIAKQDVKGAGRYIPLSPVKQHRNNKNKSNDRHNSTIDGDEKSPVS